LYFEILGKIDNVETIAVGMSIRQLKRLERTYGRGRWRKLQGTAKMRLRGGQIYYEAHGVGKRKLLEIKGIFIRITRTMVGFVLCTKNGDIKLYLSKIVIYFAKSSKSTGWNL